MILGSLPFHINFTTVLSMSPKILDGILIVIVLIILSNCISLGMTDIFTVFSVLIYEHDMSLHLFSPSLIFSSAFCNFQDTDPEHVFLRLYLNISFFL